MRNIQFVLKCWGSWVRADPVTAPRRKRRGFPLLRPQPSLTTGNIQIFA
ncbi:hypothetical protein [Arsenophonus nasoniae]|uniref:Uncharacterized protein n=1 Tax=Arsenophonus nasoniae TaxID=638 RepID=A0AA95GWD0_9GAMM|nr:hypothetical protein [Arsenophonus nasoniae]WGM04069.1 hypothetical protein QE210_21640 [Arsenophonus nasoniae]